MAASDSPDITRADIPADDALQEQVHGLLDAVEQEDGVAALSEAFVTGLEKSDVAHEHMIARQAGEVVGVAALAPDGSAELAVSPSARGRGIGTALAREILGRRDDAGLWAHGNLPAARALAGKLSLHPTRELLVMSVTGEDLLSIASEGATRQALNETALYIEELSYAESVKRWGEDAVDEAWLAVNNDAFSWHPEQGGWDRARLRSAMDTSWFDPEGVRMLWDADQRGGANGMPALVGFHWTKRHSADLGEVYVVGLSSEYRGKGLGDPLMRAGLEHLVAENGGAETVILYVEADNQPAVRRYEAMGFAVAERHVVYSL